MEFPFRLASVTNTGFFYLPNYNVLNSILFVQNIAIVHYITYICHCKLVTYYSRSGASLQSSKNIRN